MATLAFRGVHARAAQEVSKCRRELHRVWMRTLTEHLTEHRATAAHLDPELAAPFSTLVKLVEANCQFEYQEVRRCARSRTHAEAQPQIWIWRRGHEAPKSGVES